MPIPPPTPSIPYDSVETAMNMARTRFNDCILALSGNLLSDTQPYAQQYCNLAWRALQEDLADAGDPRCTQEFVTYSLPVVANIDPATQVYLNQANYFDGVSYYSSPTVNLLPQDCIFPLHMKERLGGSLNLFNEMFPCDNGLPGAPKTTYLRNWEWRNDSIYMPGATVPRDVWIRYTSYLPDIVANSPLPSTAWYNQPLQMLRSADALAWYICAEFSGARGTPEADAVAGSFLEKGRMAMRKMMNRTMKIRQRINHRRRPYAQQRHQGWNFW